MDLQQDTEKIARRCVEICEEHKAADIQLFDVRENSILADFFIVGRLERKARHAKPAHVAVCPSSRRNVVIV